MKRSKIFLGATTCVLAVVALAATKANKFSLHATGFYTTNFHNATCLRAGLGLWATQGSGEALTKVSGKSYKAQVFTASSPTTTCQSKALYSTAASD